MPGSQAEKLPALIPKKRAATVRGLDEPTTLHTLYDVVGRTEHHAAARIDHREPAPTTTPAA